MPLNLESLRGGQPPAEEPTKAPPAAAAEKPAKPAKPARRRTAVKKKTAAEKLPRSSTGVYIATTSGVSENVKTGETATFTKDVTRVRAGHWLLKQVPGAFRAAEEIVHYGTAEKATATPGESRGDE